MNPIWKAEGVDSRQVRFRHLGIPKPMVSFEGFTGPSGVFLRDLNDKNGSIIVFMVNWKPTVGVHLPNLMNIGMQCSQCGNLDEYCC